MAWKALQEPDSLRGYQYGASFGLGHLSGTGVALGTEFFVAHPGVTFGTRMFVAHLGKVSLARPGDMNVPCLTHPGPLGGGPLCDSGKVYG